MLTVKCIKKYRNKHGVIIQYELQDIAGESRIVSAESLKIAIKNNQVNCVNLLLTSDNRLIDVNSTKGNYIDTSTEKTLAKMRVLGKTKFTFENGIYIIKGNDILLVKCLETNGTFTIAKFATGIVTAEETTGHKISPFNSCKSLKIINKSNITNMSGLFYSCDELTELDLSEFDTDKVTDMSCMFSDCRKIKKLDLRNFNTSRVTNMFSMFSMCASLEEIDLSSFDTSIVQNMQQMFSECRSIKRLDIGNFYTPNVTDMSYMFFNCSDLEYIDFSRFDTSNVEQMDVMFLFCLSLKGADLSNFRLSSLKSAKNMFSAYRKDVYNKNVATFKLSEDFKTHENLLK